MPHSSDTMTDDLLLQSADIAHVCAIAVSCPSCGATREFNDTEIEECEGGTFGVSAQDRYDYCNDCGEFVDYGAVRFQAVAA